MNTRIPCRGAVAAFALATFGAAASAAELYAGGGTTGVELGVAGRLGDAVGGRLEGNAISVTRTLSTSDVDYDAKMKFVNAGVYLDWFVAGGVRLTGGALVGSRKVHGTARSSGGTILLNGVAYPVAATDTLDFDAKFPTVTPYLGVGFGHLRSDAGWHLYGDAGIAYGRPSVSLSPSASLAAKVDPNDLSAERLRAQDKANGLRAYPVIKLGLGYAF